MAGVNYKSATGELSSRRPWIGNPQFQKSREKLGGNSISGTFTDNNSPDKTYPWSGRK